MTYKPSAKQHVKTIEMQQRELWAKHDDWCKATRRCPVTVSSVFSRAARAIEKQLASDADHTIEAAWHGVISVVQLRDALNEILNCEVA